MIKIVRWFTILPAVILMVFSGSTAVLSKEGNGHGSRGNERIKIEVRGIEEEEIPDFGIKGKTFEITGKVTSFTGSLVTVDGRTITINPSAVTEFEQKGVIKVGEMIKIEGIVPADGTLLAREIKVLPQSRSIILPAESASASASISGIVSIKLKPDTIKIKATADPGVSLTTLLNQIITLLKSLITA